MQSVLKVLILVFVPILGLVSCSLNKRADDWQMAQPTVESPGQPALSLNAASRRTLAAESHLTFSGSPWERLSAKSTCLWGEKTAVNEAKISTRETLNLRELWPLAFIRTLSENELKQTECDFEFVAENEKHSTHSFSLDHIKLAGFANSETTQKFLSLDVSGEKNKSQPVAAMANDYRDDAELRLDCGAASGALSNRAVARAPDAIHSLELQLNLRGRQTCHFVAAQREPDGRTTFQLTQDLNLKFPSVSISLAVSNPVEAMAQGFSTPATPPIVRVVLTNSNDETGIVRLKNPSGIHLRMLANDLSGSKLMEPSTTIDAPVTLAVSGGNEVASRADGTRNIEIRAHETVTVDVVMAGRNQLGSCMTLYSQSASTPVGAYLGFRYGFDSPFLIEQADIISDPESTKLFEIDPSPVDHMSSSVVFDSQKAKYGATLDGLSTATRESAPNGCFGVLL